MKKLLFLLFIVFHQAFAYELEDLASYKSPYTVAETVEKIKTVAESRNVKIFTYLNYTKIGSNMGVEMPQAQVLAMGRFYFGRGVGPRLVLANPLVGLELPLRVMVYQDPAGIVWIRHTTGRYIKENYDITGFEQYADDLDSALESIIIEALKG